VTLDRHDLRPTRFGVTALCWVFWLWLRGWPTLALIVAAAGVCAVSFLSSSRLHRRRVWTNVTIAALTMSLLAGFYSGFEHVEPLHRRISALPVGRALFSVSVLWALGDSLFSLEETLVRWMTLYARALVYGVSLLAVVLLTVDGYFVGEGRAFKYPTYPPPQPARIICATRISPSPGHLSTPGTKMNFTMSTSPEPRALVGRPARLDHSSAALNPITIPTTTKRNTLSGTTGPTSFMSLGTTSGYSTAGVTMPTVSPITQA
jgi:hypothetical protein